MNIDNTMALIPVQAVKQSVQAVDQKGITRFRHNRRQGENLMTPAAYRRNDMGGHYSPYGERRTTSVMKGRVVDIFA